VARRSPVSLRFLALSSVSSQELSGKPDASAIRFTSYMRLGLRTFPRVEAGGNDPLPESWTPCPARRGGCGVEGPVGAGDCQESLQDSRLGQNKQHDFLSLLRPSIDDRLVGYENVNDAEQLCVDPTMRHVVGGAAVEYQDRPRNSILDGESACRLEGRAQLC